MQLLWFQFYLLFPLTTLCEASGVCLCEASGVCLCEAIGVCLCEASGVCLCEASGVCLCEAIGVCLCEASGVCLCEAGGVCLCESYSKYCNGRICMMNPLLLFVCRVDQAGISLVGENSMWSFETLASNSTQHLAHLTLSTKLKQRLVHINHFNWLL